MMFLTVFPATVLPPVPLLLITCMFAIGRVLLIFDITPAWRMKVVGRPQPPGPGVGGPPVYTGGTRLWASVTFPPIVLNSTSIVPVLLLTSTLPATFAVSMKVSPALSMTRACPPTVTPMSKPVVVCSAPPLTKKSPPSVDANWRHTQAEFWPMTLPKIWLAARAHPDPRHHPT